MTHTETVLAPTFELHPEAAVYKSYFGLNLKMGPWVAGGAVRRWIENKPVDSDIDVFFANEAQLLRVKDKIEQIGQYNQIVEDPRLPMLRGTRGPIVKSENALTYKIDNDKTVQLIKRRWYDSAEDVINDFDITVCQFLTDGSSVLYTQTALEDLKTKTLRFRKLAQNSFCRLIKYRCYGFEPTKQVLDQFDKNITDIQVTNLSDIDGTY